MRAATSLGWESMTRWEESISTGVIPAREYPNRSTSGLIVWSAASEAIWWLIFHRSYTVHVRTNGQLPLEISVRLPDEVAAYHAAATLISRFHADGPAALPSWRAEIVASI
jgi:hypothetical protein